MKIKRAYPPNIDKIREVLMPSENTVYTYGNTIYAPNIKNDSEIEPHLMAHEQTHEQQQTASSMTPEKWWELYLGSPAFRLEQELQAYAVQYAVISASSRISAKHRQLFLERLAKDLSGPVYGNILTSQEAASKIRNETKRFFQSTSQYVAKLQSAATKKPSLLKPSFLKRLFKVTS